MADTPSNDSGQTLSFDGIVAKAQLGELDNKVTLFKNLVNEQKNVSVEQQQNFEGYQNQFNTITSKLNESDKGLLAKIIEALRGNFTSTQGQIERYAPIPQTSEIPNDAQQNIPVPNAAQTGLNASPTDDKYAWIDETIADMDRQANERVSTVLPTIDEGDAELDVDEQTPTNGDQQVQADAEQQAADPITPEAVTLQVDVPEAIVQPEPETQNDLVASGLADIDLSDEAELQAPSISISPEDIAPQNDTDTLTSPDLGKLDTIVEEDEADLEAENHDEPEVDENALQAKTSITPSPEIGQPLADIPEGDEGEDDFDVEEDELGINNQDQFNEVDRQTPSPEPRDEIEDDEPAVVNTDTNLDIHTDTDFDAATAELGVIDIEPDTKEEHLSRNDEQIKASSISTPSLELDDDEAPSLELDDQADEVDAEPEDDKPDDQDEEDDAELTQNEQEEPEEPDAEVDAELEGGGPDITTAAKLAGNAIKKKLDDDKPAEPEPQVKKQQPPKPTPGEGKKKEEKPEEPQKKKPGPAEKENREHDLLSIAGLIANVGNLFGNVKKAGKEDVQNIKDVLEKGKNLLGIGGSKGGGGSPAPPMQSSTASIKEEPAPDSSSLAPPLKQGEDKLVAQQASMTPDGPNPDTAMLPQKSANDVISPTLKELAKNVVGADVELEADNENDNKSRMKPGP